MKKTFVAIRAAWIEHKSPVFKIGLLLLVINPIIGWLGAPLTIAVVTAVRHEPRLALWAGGGVYLLSWALLGLGILLAGKPGYRMSKRILGDIRHRIKERAVPGVIRK